MISTDLVTVTNENRPLTAINRKEIPIDTIAYFIERNTNSPYKLMGINFGIVKEHYPNCVVLQLIEPKDTRTIDGIPIKDFITPTRWQKLPKGWHAYNNVSLFLIETQDIIPQSLKFSIEEQLLNSQSYKYGIDIRKKDKILQLYKDGVFVNVEDNDHAYFDTDVDKKGWRIVRKYHAKDPPPNYMSVNFQNVYSDYEEAKKKIDEYNNELIRQSNLSYYDWSLEQINNTLNHWQILYSISDIEKQKCRDFLLSQKRIEDIETRISPTGIQWKYWKNKKWLNINFD